MATWPTCGQRGYITPAVLGVPNTQRGNKNQKWLLGPHVGKVATSPLPSWGSPTLNAERTMRNGYLAHMWAKWLHHPCRLGVPNVERGDNNAKWLPVPYVGKEATSPLPSWGSPTLNAERTMRNGYLAHMWAIWLHHPCRLGGPQRSTRGQQCEMATCPICGQRGYITPAVLGVPNAQRGDNNEKWLLGPHVGKVATSPLPSWGPQR